MGEVQNWPQRLRDELGLDVEMSVTPADKEVSRKVELRLKMNLFNAEAVREAGRPDA